MTPDQHTSIFPLEPLASRLHSTPPAPFPFMDGVRLRSFVLEAASGLVVIYNTPGIDDAAESIQSLGTPKQLLINHWHEAISGPPQLAMPAFVHERDRGNTERSMRVDSVFTRRERLGDDLEVIPSLAHTPGAAFYLWDNGEHRFLFPGDSFWVENGVWKAVILEESNPRAFLETLGLMRDLDFDVLVPWPSQIGAPALDIVSAADKHRQIDDLIARIGRGASGPRA